MNRPRNVRWCAISSPCIGAVLRGDVRIVNYPKGAELLRADYDLPSDSIRLLLWHESFDVVPDGYIAPQLNLIVEAVQC
jgi:hypothetical protein